jgi:hypothetical protein
MATTTCIEDVCGFLKWAAEIREDLRFEDDDPWTPWFRGQGANWTLCPKLYRPEYGGHVRLKKRNVENEIREEFVVRAPALCEGIPTPNDDWGWYFLMRHFDVPTRLLDWTEVPLLALYFAVRDNEGLRDAVVWALDPYELNKRAIGVEQVICPIPGVVPEQARKKVEPWLPEKWRSMKILPEWPVAVYPTHIARRISTQRSNFTIHGRDTRGLDEMTSTVKGCLFSTRIPSTSVQNIRRELERNGIDDSMAYPDLGGLGHSLCLKWQLDSYDLPHKGVYTRLRPSPIHGVGVFAIRQIKKGMRLFSGDNEEMLWVDEKRVPKGPSAIRELYDDFAVIDKARRHGCPKHFNRLTMSWYINAPKEGDLPNVRLDPTTYDVWALRDIAPEEELTAEYDLYSERPKDRYEGTRKPTAKKRRDT